MKCLPLCLIAMSSPFVPACIRAFFAIRFSKASFSKDELRKLVGAEETLEDMEAGGPWG